ncbi:similar to Saccharomyces cerevisiae YDL099W BUG1 Cis-golgi localized protein involved in ER to Golgi transport [Maudiozyma saulgeensis]|uniref:Similar to Saccharomyces cerevisiae YDL099W BUG1 Cis-golgi localized protein involved in ER to Golgi transport n=1 Tax=Maudiozyma saulgeensis TaxID=1789683 RepID=A0A1X7QZI3_9SACH|nr:similar to Saccharomyces cerevisiae YDL099W BUG1 Cis-golgi localized protein involved in ER to Golgi transport [Kazachstania saulgeensis]
MSEEDDKRAKQLEEARKRVEELKNKKKNKNKNKKNKNKNKNAEKIEEASDVTLEKVGTDNASEETPEISTNDKNSDSELVEQDTAIEENKEAESADVEETPEMNEVLSQQTGPEEAETKSEEASIEMSIAEPKEIESVTETDEETKDEPTTEEPVSEEVSEPKEPIVEEPVVEGTTIVNESDKTNANKLFDTNEADDDDDFMSSIQKEKDNIEIDNLNAQIKKMAEEIKKLKFMNMEQETTIEEQEAELEQNKISLQSVTTELENSNKEVTNLKIKLNEAERRINSQTSVPAMQFAQFNSPQPAQLPNMGNNDYINDQQQIQAPVIDRVMLDKWHNWNIDMTSWRSIGSGPIVEF